MLCRYYYKEDVRQTDRFAPIWRTRLTRFDTNRTQLLRSTTTHARCFRIWTRLVSENNKTRLPERVNLTASVLGRNGSMPISTSGVSCHSIIDFPRRPPNSTVWWASFVKNRCCFSRSCSVASWLRFVASVAPRDLQKLQIKELSH